MKKLVSGLVIGGMLSTCVFAYSATTSLIANKATFKVMVRGQEYVSETPPIVVDGRTFLPLRAMGEVLGVSVEWNAEKNQAEVGMSTNAQNSVEKPFVMSDSEKAMWKKDSWQAAKATFKVIVRGNEFVSENPPIVVEGRTFLPLRALGDALGVKVDWNEQLRQAEVDMSKTEEPLATQAPAAPATPTPVVATSTPAAVTSTLATTSSSSKTTESTSKSSTSGKSTSSTAKPASTATPAPTATSAPTATPVPTATSASTATPVPTATSASTATPVSTATPAPATTPSSVATPAASATPASVATPTPDDMYDDEDWYYDDDEDWYYEDDEDWYYDDED